MIFDGKAFAQEIESQVAERVKQLGRAPVVTSILVGKDPASELYTSLKQKAAERVGIVYRVVRLASGKEIGEVIENDQSDGIMIQLPIPGVSREQQDQIVKLIPLEKDVDGLRWEESNIMPATVRAILSILEKIQSSELSGSSELIWKKKSLVVGGTGAVGRPLVHYLKQNYGVEAAVANSKTLDLQSLARKADVVISCVGRAGLITKDMINEYDPSTGSGQVVIDVGISANQRISESANQSRVVGDMELDVYNAVRVAVPVPGGVGPVTVASLMKNAYEMSSLPGVKELPGI